MKKRLQLNNTGASLTTVIVIVTFLTMIATTMLYITSVNYQSKHTDYTNKQAFYRLESALDSLKAVIMISSQEAYEYAYTTVMSQYAAYQTKDERNSIFTKAYITYLEEEWKQKKTDAGLSGMEGAVKNALIHQGVDSSLVDCFLDLSMLEAGEEAADYTYDLDKGLFVLKNIRVRYIENGSATYIYTCIACNVPEISWDQKQFQNWDGNVHEYKQVDLSDYIIYVNWKKY